MAGWLGGYVARWLCGCVAVWLGGWVARWLGGLGFCFFGGRVAGWLAGWLGGWVTPPPAGKYARGLTFLVGVYSFGNTKYLYTLILSLIKKSNLLY